ncbi:nuclear transport factor 2 family protein [Celerinatantimonas yamalensis]|uniref:Nuclear transport factor 2 family protein n=1 Tax=Celerinatantimonas yamalensis TaxID=559956 RepID=A0ABW9GA15_9GAMM
MKKIGIATLFSACLLATPAFATLLSVPSAPVITAPDADSLFTSTNPKLNANKQVVYHIIRDLLEAGHWELASRYLSPEYIQHNPNAASGRKAIVDYFTHVLKVKPRPIPQHIQMGITSVVAEGDLVIVSYPRKVNDSHVKGGQYTTTWFDMWRIKNGKAVEHWDPALRMRSPTLE